ncbi:MAG: response regulator [Alphaproteobacteria bacterium]|nr:response regulator [Alphaproteobacteria bacterium]
MSESGQIELLEQGLEAEFLEEVRDVVAALDVLLGNLRSRSVKAGEALDRIGRDMLTVATRGRSIDQTLITVVAHRMGEYAADLKEPSDSDIDDMGHFLEALRKIAEAPASFGGEAGAKLVRDLPGRRQAGGFDPKDVKITNVEILLVVPEKAMSRIIERELAACGYRVSNARTPFQAIETAVVTRPDMVIASAVLDGLSGIDLACALSAMPSTNKLPVAILTSFSAGHPSLEGLPNAVPLIRKGSTFGDDLAEAFSKLNIT